MEKPAQMYLTLGNTKSIIRIRSEEVQKWQRWEDLRLINRLTM